MKKILFIASLLFSTLAFAQIDVPEAVLAAFDEKYPDAEDVSWKKLKINYQATFEDLETTMAQFTPEGKWVKTTVIISEDELPVVAAEHLSENFEDAEISQVQMIENSEKETIYHVVLLYDNEKIKIKFDEEGIVIEK